MKKIALGKGLQSLIPQADNKRDEVLDAPHYGVIHELSINDINPSKQQPRHNFDETKLQELMASIKEQGLIQPIIVKKIENEKFELIAGERRFRAVKALGIEKIPAIIKEFTEERILEIALIENIQRQDLNSIEEAEAYQRLINQFNLTQEVVSQKVGKDRATVANTLRLLKLPEMVKDMLIHNEITSGHARALLSISHVEKQIALAKEIIDKGLTVRQAEVLAKAIENPSQKNKLKKSEKTKDLEIVELEDNLKKFFGTRVMFKTQGKKGSIEIEYHSVDDLRRILEIIGYKY